MLTSRLEEFQAGARCMVTPASVSKNLIQQEMLSCGAAVLSRSSKQEDAENSMTTTPAKILGECVLFVRAHDASSASHLKEL